MFVQQLIRLLDPDIEDIKVATGFIFRIRIVLDSLAFLHLLPLTRVSHS